MRRQIQREHAPLGPTDRIICECWTHQRREKSEARPCVSPRRRFQMSSARNVAAHREIDSRSSAYWEERFYTLPPPGSNLRDCKCARIEITTSIRHPLWVLVVHKIALPDIHWSGRHGGAGPGDHPVSHPVALGTKRAFCRVCDKALSHNLSFFITLHDGAFPTQSIC